MKYNILDNKQEIPIFILDPRDKIEDDYNGYVTVRHKLCENYSVQYIDIDKSEVYLLINSKIYLVH